MALIRRHALLWLAVLVALGLVVAMTAGPVGLGADHLDAPGLTSPDGNGQADINDLYVFEGADTSNTVLAVTTNPGAGALSPDTFGDKLLYQFKIDTSGDAVADLSYNVTFGKERDGTQKYKIKLAQGNAATKLNNNGQTIAQGRTGSSTDIKTGGEAFTGLRSDPFFFDLSGFLGTVEGAMNGRMLNDGMESDPFAAFNTLAIVLEVPDTVFDGPIGVWAVTSMNGKQIDRMGRPAINTVVNSSGPVVGAPSAAKNVYNVSDPADDVANFTTAVIGALQAYSSLDAEGPYATSEAAALANVLLPDVLTFDKASVLPAPLNGRALPDDVIDTELNIVTGGDPLGLFPGRDAVGGISTDGIGPHTDYLADFPYLGDPN